MPNETTVPVEGRQQQPQQVDAATPITQNELQELMQRVATHKALGLLWHSMRLRVAKGDPVEAGEIEPVLVEEQVAMNKAQYKRIAETQGQERADAIVAELASKPCLRMKLKIGDQILGFYEL